MPRPPVPMIAMFSRGPLYCVVAGAVARIAGFAPAAAMAAVVATVAEARKRRRVRCSGKMILRVSERDYPMTPGRVKSVASRTMKSIGLVQQPLCGRAVSLVRDGKGDLFEHGGGDLRIEVRTKLIRGFQIERAARSAG